MVMYLGISLLLLNACKKKEVDLIPTEEPEPGFKLPQGSNDYDQRIMGYYQRWGTYVLYKFSKQDIDWRVTGYDTYYKSVPALENYINPQLDLLENTFFKYYADSTLKKYLPVKVFLCSSLMAGTVTTQVDAYLLSLANTNIGGYQSFAVNGANANVLAINKTLFRANINFSFLRMMDVTAKMEKSITFFTLTDYATPVTGSTVADRYKRGFLGSTATLPSFATDWHAYIQAIVANPYSYLTDVNTTAADVTAKGILSPVKDPNGLIKRKYDAILKFYKDRYNIDLQRIGDGV